MTKKTFTALDLTMGELAQLEEITGMPLGLMGSADKPQAKFMTGLAWLSKRREVPSFTFNEAETLTLAEVQAIIGSGDDEETD
jgi:hypothetical protein